MVEIGSQKMHNVALNDCRSFDSNQYPSGRFPKVSIGITVDKWSKTGPGLKKEDAAALPSGGRTFSCQGAEEAIRPGTVEKLDRNILDDFEKHKASPWFSTRSEQYAGVETVAAETAGIFEKSASVLHSEDGMHKRIDTVAYGKKRGKNDNVDRVEDIEYAAMQETELVDKQNTRKQTPNFSEKRLNTVGYGKRTEKGRDPERTKEAAFSTKQSTGEENGNGPEKMAKCSNESLKMKLWEILGTAPSDKKHSVNSPDYRENSNTNQSRENQTGKVAKPKLIPNLEENKQNLNINQKEREKSTAAKENMTSRDLKNRDILNVKKNKDFQKGKATRSKQNSDTIETDSESPNQVMRRPITRSLTKKKSPSRRIQTLHCNVSASKKLLSSPSSDFKLKHRDENIFVFDEVDRKSGSLCHTSSGHSNKSRDKINGPVKAEIELQKFYCPQYMRESLHNNDRDQTFSSPAKSVPQSKEKENSSVSAHHKKQSLQTGNGTASNNCHSQRAGQLNIGSPMWPYNRVTREDTDSPLIKLKKHSWEHENSPPESKNTFLHDGVASGSVGRKIGQLGDFHSPAHIVGTSPTSPVMPDDEVLSSPEAVRPNKSIQNDYSSKDLDNSTPGSCQPEEAEMESSDDTTDTKNPGEMESAVMKDEEHEKQKCSSSLMEDHDTESEADQPTFRGFGSADKWFPSTGSPEKSPFSLRQTKRVRSLDNAKLREAKLPSPSSASTTRTEETAGSLGALEQYPEGSLERCVAQLALVLERFKKRIRSQTSKRSSEILTAAADKIRQQLQDVESLILVDVQKFNNIGQAKRKRLESRFHEQQERLKVIHEKFKEEVNQHLSDCKTTLQELEAYYMELKGTADHQKALHRKLVQKAEKEMGAQINDAETNIAAVQKDARKKMIGLKRTLQEWMD